MKTCGVRSRGKIEDGSGTLADEEEQDLPDKWPKKKGRESLKKSKST